MNEQRYTLVEVIVKFTFKFETHALALLDWYEEINKQINPHCSLLIIETNTIPLPQSLA